MPTYDLVIKVDGDTLDVPYEQRRVRVQELEVSSWREPGQAYGTAVLHDEMWRIVRVTEAPAGLASMLEGRDALTDEDLGKDFSPRRRLYYLIFEVADRVPLAARGHEHDYEIGYPALVYIRKDPEPRDLSGLPVETP